MVRWILCVLLLCSSTSASAGFRYCLTDEFLAVELPAEGGMAWTLFRFGIPDPAASTIQTLDSPARYVGALGSRRTHAKRIDSLRDLGVADDAIARIRAPIGLDLGGRSPAEIAVSIIAELVADRRGGDGAPMNLVPELSRDVASDRSES